jgi:hypothetical protein
MPIDPHSGKKIFVKKGFRKSTLNTNKRLTKLKEEYSNSREQYLMTFGEYVLFKSNNIKAEVSIKPKKKAKVKKKIKLNSEGLTKGQVKYRRRMAKKKAKKEEKRKLKEITR